MTNHEKVLDFTSNQVVANKKHKAFLLSHHYYQLCCLWVFMCMSSMHMHTQFYWELKGPRAWCWERLKARGEGKDRGWDGWMASPTQWTWVWVNSRSWWWTGKPGLLQSMGSQRFRHNWATEWTDLLSLFPALSCPTCQEILLGYFKDFTLMRVRVLSVLSTVLSSGKLVEFLSPWCLFHFKWLSYFGVLLGVSPGHVLAI